MPKGAAVALFVSILLCGCGDSSGPGPGSVPAARGGGSTNAAPAADRDLSGVDGCDLIKGTEVLALAGGAKLAAPPTPFPGGCLYVVELPGGAGERYQFAYQSATLERVLIDHTEPEEHMQKIAGPWDDAIIGPQPLGKGIRLIAVVGGVGIEVSGDRNEPSTELAKLAAARAP